MRAEAVHRIFFFHVHNFITFIDGLHLVRIYEDQTQKVKQFAKQKCSSKFHKVQAVNKTRQEFRHELCTLINCKSGVFTIYLIWLTVAGQKSKTVPCKMHVFRQFAISFELLYNGVCIMQHQGFTYTNQRTNGPVAHLRLFDLSKLMVTFLKNGTYTYGSQYSLKNLISLYPTITWYGI